MSNRVSLAELAAADLKLRPSEAVAIVAAICAQHIAGTLPGIPSPGVIRLTRQGDVVAEGPITTAQDDVSRAALLLNMLLSGSDALPEYRASGALRLVISRALGTIDVPPYGSLAEFCTALSRFATEDVRSVAQALFSAWERSSGTRALKSAPRVDLTISDVRRARRATGLSLAYLATVAELPRTRLRDLEWGYMRDWPATEEGRAQVIRYARAAGLDESIVLSIAWPMIVEGSPRIDVEVAPGVALVRSTPQSTALVPAAAPATAARRVPRVWRRAFVAAAAAIALIAAFVLGARLAQSRAPHKEGIRVGLSDRTAPIFLLPAADTTPAPVVTDAPASPDLPPEPVAREPQHRAASTPAGAAPRPKPRRAPAAAPRQGGRKSFFQRELFRIVIR